MHSIVPSMYISMDMLDVWHCCTPHPIEAKAGMGKIEVLFVSSRKVVHDHYRMAEVKKACNQV